MGACTFQTFATGNTARAAFSNAVERAAYENGHGGYTGTIAEKRDFVMVRDTVEDLRKRLASEAKIREDDRKTWLGWLEKPLDGRKTALNISNILIELSDRRIDDKWGPAGCIEVDPKTWLFFGWASE